MFSFDQRLARIPIGDALVARSGHRIDYMDANCDGHEPCYAVVAPDNTIQFLSRNDTDKARAETLRFWDEYHWRAAGYRPPTDVSAVRDGAADNPLWQMPIRTLTIADPDWFFAPSPHTECYRTQALALHERNMEAIYDAGGSGNTRYAKAILVTRSREDVLTFEPHYQRHGIYALKKNATTQGYLRLHRIQSITAAQVDFGDAFDCGYPDVTALWKALRYNNPHPQRVVYRLLFDRIYSHIDQVPAAKRIDHENSEPARRTAS